VPQIVYLWKNFTILKRKKTQDILFVRVAIIILALAYILKHRLTHHVPLYVAVARSYE